MISLDPAIAPTGKPPPKILPKTVMSGNTLKNCCAPPGESLNPVMTSSKTSKAPFSEHSSLNAFKNSFSAGMQPPAPSTGSTTTAASFSFLIAFSTLLMSLKGKTTVSFKAPSVSPLDSGTSSGGLTAICNAS